MKSLTAQSLTVYCSINNVNEKKIRLQAINTEGDI